MHHRYYSNKTEVYCAIVVRCLIYISCMHLCAKHKDQKQLNSTRNKGHAPNFTPSYKLHNYWLQSLAGVKRIIAYL